MWNRAWCSIAKVKGKETHGNKAATRGTKKKLWGELSLQSGGKLVQKWPGTRSILQHSQAEWTGKSGEKSLGHPVLKVNWVITLNSRHSEEVFETSCYEFAAVGRKINFLRNLDNEITITMPLLLFGFYVTCSFGVYFATLTFFQYNFTTPDQPVISIKYDICIFNDPAA